MFCTWRAADKDRGSAPALSAERCCCKSASTRPKWINKCKKNPIYQRGSNLSRRSRVSDWRPPPSLSGGYKRGSFPPDKQADRKKKNKSSQKTLSCINWAAALRGRCSTCRDKRVMRLLSFQKLKKNKRKKERTAAGLQGAVGNSWDFSRKPIMSFSPPSGCLKALKSSNCGD